ncbi:peptide ligase PGM1-related protein [Thermodesulfobacteriota bacterium]
MAQTDIKSKFATIQKRLKSQWETISTLNNTPQTIIVVPSLTLDPRELNKIKGIVHYEERFLFMLMLLRQPNCELFFVSSQQIHPYIIDYYLQNLPGIPYSHAKKRLKLFTTYDLSPVPLSKKLLDRPQLLKRIKSSIKDSKNAHLSTFVTTELERELAVRLNVALYGTDPELNYLGTKSGSRKAFKKVKVNCPDGFEDIYTKAELLHNTYELFKKNPALNKVLVKLNDSFSGEGNAFVSRPKVDRITLKSVEESIKKMKFLAKGENVKSFLKSLREMGGIVEECIESKNFLSPSVQLRVTPFGKVELLSTHDQILGGRGNQVYLGCRFPAEKSYRGRINEDSVKVGELLAKKGAIGRFSIDYVITTDKAGNTHSHAIEINLRKGGTTHPFLTLDFLVNGKYDPVSGEYNSSSGTKKYYVSSDNVQSEAYKGILPDDLFEISALANIYYSNVTETGVVLHLIGALSEFGKVGITCIGNSMEEAENFFEKMVKILDKEAKKNNRIS